MTGIFLILKLSSYIFYIINNAKIVPMKLSLKISLLIPVLLAANVFAQDALLSSLPADQQKMILSRIDQARGGA